MGINIYQLNKYVVTPALKEINLYSESARNLILGTAAQESGMGTYIHQINGEALGIYQCKPDTHNDIWENYINYHEDLKRKIGKLCAQNLINNLKYATIICRIHYLRVPKELPTSTDIYSIAMYWKSHYDTNNEKGNVYEFVDNYKNFKIDKI